MSWIIQPSYQPLSLLITNSPEMSVNTSMNAFGSLGSVGSPGFGSSTTRTDPMLGKPQLAWLAAVGKAASLMLGTMLVKSWAEIRWYQAGSIQIIGLVYRPPRMPVSAECYAAGPLCE